MTADPEILYRALAEMLDHVHDAQRDTEDIASAAGWGNIGPLAGDIENAANVAASALEDLAKLLAQALKAVPGGAS